MPYLDLEHTAIYYEDEGNGKETLVFGHSMLFNLRMFDAQVEKLKNEFRCLRFDFRGHGKSEVTEDGYDLDTQTEDIAELIKKLHCAPCHFIGFSMGGMVAMRLAIKYPELIKSLVLIDTSSEPEPKDNMFRNKLMLVVARYLGLRPLGGKVLSLFFGKVFLKDPNRKKLRKTWKMHFLANDHVGIVRAVNAILYRKGITNKLSEIDHPVTIIVGAEDQLTDISRARLMQSHLKNSTVVEVPRAGHMSPVEEPEIVTKAIYDHLRNLRK